MHTAISATRPRLSPAIGQSGPLGSSGQTARANAAMLRYAQGDDSAFPELYRLLDFKPTLPGSRGPNTTFG